MCTCVYVCVCVCTPVCVCARASVPLCVQIYRRPNLLSTTFPGTVDQRVDPNNTQLYGVDMCVCVCVCVCLCVCVVVCADLRTSQPTEHDLC